MKKGVFPGRQVHLDFHTSPDIPDVGAAFCKEEFQQALKTGHIDSITVFAKCHHANFYYPTALGHMHPHLTFDLTGAMVEAAHEIGVRAPIYITAGWAEAEAELHPEWREKDENGNDIRWNMDSNAQPEDPKPFCAWQFLCLNDGNEYTNYIYAIVQEICERYPQVDGLFFDICVVGNACYCDSCRRGMAAEGLDARKTEDAQRYYVLKHTAFMKKCNDILQKYHPGATIFFNSGGADQYRPQYHPFQTHFEMEDLPTAWGGYDKMPVRAKFFSKTGKPYLGMTGKFHRDWGEFGGYKTKEALKFEVASMALFGAGCSVGDHLHPTGKVEMQTYENIGYAYRYLEKIAPFCYGGSSTAKLGVVLSENQISDSGLCKILLENQIDFDLVTGDDFERFDTVIVPDGVCPDETGLQTLRAYIRNGGKVLFYGKSLIRDGKFQLDCGLEFQGESPYDCDYIRCGEALEDEVLKAPLLCYSTAVRTENRSASVLASVVNPYFSRTYAHFCGHRNTPYRPEGQACPGAAQKGNILYMAHDIPAMYDEHGCVFHKRYFVSLLKRLYSRPVFEIGPPAQGRCTLIRQDEQRRYCMNMVYASPVQRGSTCVIEDIVPLYQIPVKLRVAEEITRVYSGVDGTEIPFRKQDGVYTFDVPKLDCHCSVVVEY